MTPREHLDIIVRPNMAAMMRDLDDLRLAFNAIASVDSLAAQIYWWAFFNNKPFVQGFADDSAWRAHLATQDNDFRLLFETAKTVKHGRLTHGKSPSVRAIDQVVAKSPGWGDTRWGDARWDIDQVRIEPIGETPWAVEGILERALAFLEGTMALAGIP